MTFVEWAGLVIYAISRLIDCHTQRLIAEQEAMMDEGELRWAGLASKCHSCPDTLTMFPPSPRPVAWCPSCNSFVTPDGTTKTMANILNARPDAAAAALEKIA